MELAYDFDLDEHGNDSATYRYEVSLSALEKALQSIVDIPPDDVPEAYVEEHFDSLFEEHYDSLKEYFEDDAREEFEEARKFEEDPYGFLGISEKDFH